MLSQSCLIEDNHISTLLSHYHMGMQMFFLDTANTAHVSL